MTRNAPSAEAARRTMQLPTDLLTGVARAVAEVVNSDLLTEDIVRADADLVRAVWDGWAASTDAARLAEVQALAAAPGSQIEEAVAPLVARAGAGQSAANRRAISGYVLQVPATIRLALRRPGDPRGRTWPAYLPLRQAADLLPLLPARLPWLEPLATPAGAGGLQLVELVVLDTESETWKAIAPESPGQPPVALRFLSQATAQFLQTTGAPVLQRLAQPLGHPGVLQLRQARLDASPPCLEYDFTDAFPLAHLVREWHAPPGRVDALAAARLVLQIAEALGHLHRLAPPMVHGRLTADAVQVRAEADGTLSCQLVTLGLADVPRSYGPRDDVFALGLLWYQLLSGSLTAGRPGGSQWRRKLLDQGTAPALVELLEACFEDDPNDRPADGAQLAARLSAALVTPTFAESRPAPQAAQPPPAPAAPGPRRRGGAMLDDLFGALEKEEKPLQPSVTNGLGMKLMLIQPGAFSMGSPPEEVGRRENEGPRHEVTLGSAFYLGAYPVTQQQYERVMGRNPARFHAQAGGGAEHPVENVSFEEAEEFCRRLGQLPAEKEARRSYRLPTEAEWEYACRAGTTTPFSFGATLDATQANFDGNFPYGGARGRNLQQTTRVGAYAPNNWGLYDLHGNVWEWCADWLAGDAYQRQERRNPRGPARGRFRVIRGGSWRNHAATCRSAYRNGLGPQSRDSATGFRVVLVAQGS